MAVSTWLRLISPNEYQPRHQEPACQFCPTGLTPRGGLLPYSGRDCSFCYMMVHRSFDFSCSPARGNLPSKTPQRNSALETTAWRGDWVGHTFLLQTQNLRLSQFIYLCAHSRKGLQVALICKISWEKNGLESEKDALPCVMRECQKRVYFGHWRAPWFCQSVQSSSFPSGEKWSPFRCITAGYWNHTGQQAVPEKQPPKKSTQSSQIVCTDKICVILY